MKTKTLKFIGLAAVLAMGMGVASIGQAAVVIVRQPPPPPPPMHTQCTFNKNFVVCYHNGYPQKYYPYSKRWVCGPRGCFWKNCYKDEHGIPNCYNFYPNRVY